MRGALRLLASSVRIRVTATALIAVAVALAILAGVLAAGLHHDRQKVMTAAASQEAGEVVSFNPDLTPPLILPLKATVESGLIQVLKSGRILGSSRALHRMGPLWSPGQPLIQPVSDALADVAADGWVVAVPVTTGTARAMVIVVISMQQYDHTISLIVTLLGWTSAALLFLLAVICWFTVGRALRPIELMRREVAEVATVRGMHRIAEPSGDDEVARLARTLNSMLDRLQASSERERRFVADASHELRSPIANIRTELEVALHNPSLVHWDEVAGDVLSENERMEQLVAGLLILARSDEGSLIGAGEPTNVVDVVAGMAAAATGAGPPPVTVEPAPGADLLAVEVPQVYLERLVGNLVDNARRFASTAVAVRVGRAGPMVEIRVRDDGPGVPAADRTRVFERFVRLDEARNRQAGGFGLGLAIVADLSRFYRGSIEVVDARPGVAPPGAEFVLRLPMAVPGVPMAVPGPPMAVPVTGAAPPSAGIQPAYRDEQAGRDEGRTSADKEIRPADSASIDVH